MANKNCRRVLNVAGSTRTDRESVTTTPMANHYLPTNYVRLLEDTPLNRRSLDYVGDGKFSKLQAFTTLARDTKQKS